MVARCCLSKMWQSLSPSSRSRFDRIFRWPASRVDSMIANIGSLGNPVTMTRRQAVLLCSAALTSSATKGAVGPDDRVRLLRTPQAGLQPQAGIDDRGILHLVYFSGEAHQGDSFYASSPDGGATFAPAVRVNSQPESAIAAGTIRGAQLAIGKAGPSARCMERLAERRTCWASQSRFRQTRSPVSVMIRITFRRYAGACSSTLSCSDHFM